MKNKFTILFLSVFILSLDVIAQESVIDDVNNAKLEQFIEAARNNYPRRKIVSAQKDIAKVGVTTATLSYLDIFNASYFYRPNDQTAITAPGVTNNPYIVNGIQYGINVNLGTFLQKPFLVKRAKSELKVAQLQEQDYDLSLVTEVKKRYYTYIQMLTELKIRTQTAQENSSVVDNIRNKFERGEVTLDFYNNSRITLAESNSQKIQIEVNFLIARDALEEIIGKKISDFK